jgi:glycosyltransferase involved in cell wall biosynthesis
MTETISSHTLAFFMSSGASLGQWRRAGIFDREFQLLLEFLRRGLAKRILLFTYDPADADVIRTHSAVEKNCIEVLAPPLNLHRLGRTGAVFYALWGPIYHRKSLAHASLLRTNQISGAWAAVVAKMLCRCPLIIRLGYILSRRYQKDGRTLLSWLMYRIEGLCYGAADAIIVTSRDAHSAIASRLREPSRVHLNPTFVDMSVFRPKQEYDFDAPIVYVGRLIVPKNLDNLVRAAAAGGLQLHIFGDGEKQAELAALASSVGCNLEFKGLVPNWELANRLQSYTIFVLPSHYEGLPKALIEAMATGLICVGSTIPGITDLIEDGVSGYLIPGFDAGAIEATLRRATKDKSTTMGRAARSKVEKLLGIDHHIATEAKIHRLLLEEWPARSH